MPDNTTLYSPMDVLHQQFIVICVVIATAVLLLVAILAILISAIVERCRKRGEERGIECQVFLSEQGGNIIGTIRTGPSSDRDGTYTPRTGLGYEHMFPGGRGGESIYETVQ